MAAVIQMDWRRMGAIILEEKASQKAKVKSASGASEDGFGGGAWTGGKESILVVVESAGLRAAAKTPLPWVRTGCAAPDALSRPVGGFGGSPGGAEPGGLAARIHSRSMPRQIRFPSLRIEWQRLETTLVECDGSWRNVFQVLPSLQKSVVQLTEHEVSVKGSELALFSVSA